MTSVWKSRIILGAVFMIVFILTSILSWHFFETDIAFTVSMMVGGSLMIGFGIVIYLLLRNTHASSIEQHNAFVGIPITTGQGLSFMLMGINTLIRSDILRYGSFAPLLVGIVVGIVFIGRYRPTGEESTPVSTLTVAQSFKLLIVFIVLLLLGVAVIFGIVFLVLSLLPNLIIGSPN